MGKDFDRVRRYSLRQAGKICPSPFILTLTLSGRGTASAVPQKHYQMARLQPLRETAFH